MVRFHWNFSYALGIYCLFYLTYIYTTICYAEQYLQQSRWYQTYYSSGIFAADQHAVVNYQTQYHILRDKTYYEKHNIENNTSYFIAFTNIKTQILLRTNNELRLCKQTAQELEIGKNFGDIGISLVKATTNITAGYIKWRMQKYAMSQQISLGYKNGYLVPSWILQFAILQTMQIFGQIIWREPYKEHPAISKALGRKNVKYTKQEHIIYGANYHITYNKYEYKFYLQKTVFHKGYTIGLGLAYKY